jgi:peptide-methionine (R)-S-oxide reductase
MSDKIELTDAEWRERLTPEQYAILRQKGTERAFTGEYEKNKTPGEYVCAGCGQPLFESDDKFESGSGWPSFTRPADDGAVAEHRDMSHGMVRTEVVTFSRTDRVRKGCAIASTARRSHSSRRMIETKTRQGVNGGFQLLYARRR